MYFWSHSTIPVTHKTEKCELNDNLVKQMQSWVNHCKNSVRLVGHFPLGKEAPVDVPKVSVLSHVLPNIITNNLYKNVKANLSYLQISHS